MTRLIGPGGPDHPNLLQLLEAERYVDAPDDLCQHCLTVAPRTVDCLEPHCRELACVLACPRCRTAIDLGEET